MSNNNIRAPSPAVKNVKMVNGKPIAQSQHIKTKSEITRDLLNQAQKKAPKFERAPFDPNATISYFETEQENQRVTPRRNYRGNAAENPSSYFEFPVPSWVPANQTLPLPPPANERSALPKGIMSVISNANRRMTMDREGGVPVSFPNLDVVRANSRPQPSQDRNDDDDDDDKFRVRYDDRNFNVTKEKETKVEEMPSVILKHRDENDDQEKREREEIQKRYSSLLSSMKACNEKNINLLFEFETRERKLIEEHAQDLFVNHFIVLERETKIRLLGAGSQNSRRKYDKAMEDFLSARLDLIGNASVEMTEILWDQFDLTNPNSLIYSLLSAKAEDQAEQEALAKKKRNENNNNNAKKDKAAELSDLESSVMQLEASVSWHKFERKRLEDLLRQEIADAVSARASRDAAMQQLASLEAECVPLLQGMREIFGQEDISHSNNNNSTSTAAMNLFPDIRNMSNNNCNKNSSAFTSHSIIGSFMGNNVKTALEMVADQIEQSSFHQQAGNDDFSSLSLNQNDQSEQNHRNGENNINNINNFSASSVGGINLSRQDQKLKRTLQSLTPEILASMLLLERQLSNRMLIGAKSQVFAEVEAQRRFVDTTILMKKQAAHTMFLADLFQHRLPQLRRAASALGNVVHKFENSCSTSTVPRHKSNVVSRHNPGCCVGSSDARSGSVEGAATSSGGGHHLTHSALVAYSKSLVAHVGAMLKWLDCEVTN